MGTREFRDGSRFKLGPMPVNLRKTRAVLPKKKKAAEPPPTLLEGDATASEVMKRIRETLSPIKLSLVNTSAKHKGHKAKGSHYDLLVVSELFIGVSALQRQKIIHSLLKDLIGKKIHALKMELKDPTQMKLEENP